MGSFFGDERRLFLFYSNQYMKKLLFAVTSIILFASCAKQEGNLVITGDIKGLNQGKIYFQKIKDTTLTSFKAIKFDGNSSFKTYLDIEEPEVIYLFLDRGTSNSLDNHIAFFAEKGKMHISADVDNFTGKAKITGNKNQELLNDYRSVITTYTQKNIEIVENRIKADWAKNTRVSDSLKKIEDGIVTRKYQFTINFCLNNPDAEIAPYLAITEIYDANPKYLDSIYNSLVPKVKQSKYGKKLSEYLGAIKENTKN